MKELPQQNCPICGVELSSFSRGRTFHAREHQLTSQQLFDLVNQITQKQTCKCSILCNKEVSWYNWDEGYCKFARGHGDKAVQQQKSQTLKTKIASGEIVQWYNTKPQSEVDNIRQIAASKTSKMLKEGFVNGKITHWSATNNLKEVCAKISAAHIARYIAKPRSHWKRYETEKILEIFQEILGDQFSILLSKQELTTLLDARKNNVACNFMIHCNKCEINREVSVYYILRHPTQLKCQSCDREFSSVFEKEISDFVQTLGVSVSRRTLIDGIGELDIYVPKLNFGIECNGLYWHSDAVQKNKHYHQQKTESCRQKSIKLFHIFEDEWRDKRKICESMILHRLKKHTNIMGARKLKIEKIDIKSARDFMNFHHLEGHAAATHALALLDNNKQIYACLTLRKPLQKKWSKFLEVCRFATLNNISVPGSLSRLSKAAIEIFKQPLFTYVDQRYGDAVGYLRSGFILVAETAERFWWTDTKNRIGRLSIKANSHESEAQIVELKRVFRIYGCKNFVLTKQLL